MKPVFISYSSKDRDFVDGLRADLQANNVNVWIDQTGLKPGTRNWKETLREALREASAVLLIASPSSRQSVYVQGELAIAEMYKCPVYPIWAAGEEWADSISLDMVTTQYIDARGAAYTTAIPQIVEALGQGPTPVELAEPSPKEKLNFEPHNPYKGLLPFTEEDRRYFFGRDVLIDELVEALGEQIDNDRLLAVIGPSGSGKSSAVMAGLLPRLREGALPGSADWVYLDRMVPGAHPLRSLAIAIANALPDRPHKVIRDDLEDPEGQGLHLLGGQVAHGADKRLVLFVDQFEELFTQTVSEDECQQFITLLVTAATEPNGPVTLILTLRADFYDRPMELGHENLGKLLVDHHRAVLPMSLEDLRAVIEKPAALPDVQLTFEGDLVGDLLFEVREQVGGLPLLQFTLDQLFEQRQNHTLTLAAYQEMGGLKGALARHAEATYDGLKSDEHRRLARTVFLRLIEAGATEQDTTRRRADMTELKLPDAEQTEILREVADAFVEARLLTIGEVAEKATIEVSHEALVQEWKRLEGWLSEARDDIIIQQDVSSDAGAWIERGRHPDDDGLYRGAVLKEALEWAARNDPSQDEIAFIEAAVSLEARQAEADHQRREREAATARKAEEYERRARQFRRWTIVFVVVFVLASVVAGYALSETTSAQNLRTTAEWQATYFALKQGRVVTLGAGGVILAAAESTQVPADFIATLTQVAKLNNWTPTIELDEYGVEMVQVPAGCFWMGSMFQQDEQPAHEVCFDKPFWIDRYEVTNEQFGQLGGEAENESTWPNPDQPRTDITWFEARDFCELRGAQLPSEAQWEYAARGPDSLVYPWGDEFVVGNAVYYAKGPAAVGGDQRPDGASWVGAYDMSGNVWEWAADWYDGDYYDIFEGVAVNPAGPEDGEYRVLRGGSWRTGDPDNLRGALRNKTPPDHMSLTDGFRCASLGVAQ